MTLCILPSLRHESDFINKSLVLGWDTGHDEETERKAVVISDFNFDIKDAKTIKSINVFFLLKK